MIAAYSSSLLIKRRHVLKQVLSILVTTVGAQYEVLVSIQFRHGNFLELILKCFAFSIAEIKR